jgi:hypothetical protein
LTNQIEQAELAIDRRLLMHRPAGITVLAFAMFTAAAILLVLSYFCFSVGPVIGELVRTPGLPIFRMIGAAAVGIILLVMAFLCAGAGVGLWGMKSWGRAISILLVAISVVVSVVGIAAGLVFPQMRLVIDRIIALGVDLLVLWYLVQPQVKDAFGG